jgi:hypothetical protein
MLDQIKRWIDDGFRVHMARDHRRLLTGKVTAVDATAKRCAVKIANESISTANVPYCIDLPVAVNDDVYLEATGASYLVIGRAKLVAP